MVLTLVGDRSNISDMKINSKIPRGRPPKQRDGQLNTRELLIMAGVEVLTEKGYSAAGIDEILKRVGVPKGSFYHYFKNKESFGLEILECYAAYFARKLELHFCDNSLPPFGRIHAFVEDAKDGLRRYGYTRGCLVGRLGQEMNVLPEPFRNRLIEIFVDWQTRLASVLKEAHKEKAFSTRLSYEQLASFFWIGWEGAVLRASIERSSKAIDIFTEGFLSGLLAE